MRPLIKLAVSSASGHRCLDLFLTPTVTDVTAVFQRRDPGCSTCHDLDQISAHEERKLRSRSRRIFIRGNAYLVILSTNILICVRAVPTQQVSVIKLVLRSKAEMGGDCVSVH